MAKKCSRGLNERKINAFKQSCLSTLYKEHQNELIIGVRNGYLNLYHNCDSIAKMSGNAERCEVSTYYTDKDIKYISDKEIYEKYEDIKLKSRERCTDEKKAQAALVLKNNANPNSNWYCYDVEYKKQFESIEDRENSKFNGRFDILAISKTLPHRIAIIELKYGSGAIGGKSGIYKHIEDYKTFQDNNFYDAFKHEAIDEINTLIQLGVSVPIELHSLKETDLAKCPEFYVVTLNNNPKSKNASTPKQTMAGYLFSTRRWDCKKLSQRTVEAKFGDVTNKKNDITVTFLFSKETLDNLSIDDIIDSDKYERENPK